MNLCNSVTIHKDNGNRFLLRISALNSMRIDTLVGTLAGDDTAFLLMKDNTSADEFFHEIEKLL